MENHNVLLMKILHELEFLKTKTLENSTIGGWVNKTTFKKFLDYGDTATAEILNSGELTVSEVGRRRFIQISSLIEYLEKHRVK